MRVRRLLMSHPHEIAEFHQLGSLAVMLLQLIECLMYRQETGSTSQ